MNPAKIFYRWDGLCATLMRTCFLFLTFLEYGLWVSKHYPTELSIYLHQLSNTSEQSVSVVSRTEEITWLILVSNKFPPKRYSKIKSVMWWDGLNYWYNPLTTWFCRVLDNVLTPLGLFQKHSVVLTWFCWLARFGFISDFFFFFLRF